MPIGKIGRTPTLPLAMPVNEPKRHQKTDGEGIGLQVALHLLRAGLLVDLRASLTI